MKVGKVPESILKRTILKQIKTKREEVLLGAGVGIDCAAVKIKEDEILVLSTDPIILGLANIDGISLDTVFNDLACSGALPVGILVSILLPKDEEETKLKQIMQMVSKACEEFKVQIIGGHTQVTSAVDRPVISVTAVGKVRESMLITSTGVKAGMDIVMTKWAGMEGTSLLAIEKETDLCKHFSKEFVYKAKELGGMVSVVSEAAVASLSGVSAMHDGAEGGVFAALWELAEASGVGLEINLKKIPLKQETVEICEFFGINPYELLSGGAMLMASEDGNRLVMELEKKGVAAAVIGKATDSNDRVLYNDGERRFLEPPKTDQIYQVVQEGYHA